MSHTRDLYKVQNARDYGKCNENLWKIKWISILVLNLEYILFSLRPTGFK